MILPRPVTVPHSPWTAIDVPMAQYAHKECGVSITGQIGVLEQDSRENGTGLAEGGFEEEFKD